MIHSNFDIGQRVEWLHNEPNADPSELSGTVIEVRTVYKVRFDDGSEEMVDEEDIKAFDGN